MLIYKDFEFDSAHCLRNKDLDATDNIAKFGKCFQTHGHRYKLRVGLKGPTDPETGMVFNFTKLKEIVERNVIDKVDHEFLNSLPMFENLIPTAENMLDTFWGILDKIFKEKDIELYELVLWETPTSFARRTG